MVRSHGFLGVRTPAFDTTVALYRMPSTVGASA
jgi:hypothetical protein